MSYEKDIRSSMLTSQNAIRFKKIGTKVKKTTYS